jgi:hypothetical protein
VKDWETCAVEKEIEASKLIILSLYRRPAGDFNQFIENLYDTLKYLYKPKAEFLICGDINTDYLIESNQKKTVLIINNIYSITYSRFCNKNAK